MVNAVRPRFTLTIEASPDVDAIKALRFVLKKLLRQYGFRCLAVREVDGENAPAVTGNHETEK